MRLEFVFKKLDSIANSPTNVEQMLALNGLLDLSDLVGRGDTTSEVTKELQRIAENLKQLRHIPSVDSTRLDKILDNVGSLSSRLSQQAPRHYQATIDNELLCHLKRRQHVTCGNTEFDQPALQHWLFKPEQVRVQQIIDWSKPFVTLNLAVKLILQLIRESAQAKLQSAESGFYQQTLDPEQPVQIIRVAPDDPTCYPVISAGRHRFTLRFMRQSGIDPASQVDDQIAFQLACCAV
ncbi:MAG: cell division protein ZapD [Gammaproteobacteria bacterium]|nr:cell division protein ZapD [Gammaproteobacteria bacterium]